MSASTLTAFLPIAEGSDATPGLFNSRFQTLQDNIVSVNSVIPGTSVLSGSTWASIGLFANSSAGSDYLRLVDSTNQRSTYRIGSFAGGTADGLNIFDESGNTMLVNFSKQSIRFFQNVVGPVFNTAGDFVNVATIGTGADSRESRIQAAIDAAVLSSISHVYLPRNFLPYSAGSMSFNSQVQMVREGGDWSLYDIRAYGATGNGVVDDRTALHSLANTAIPPSGGRIYVSGPATYRLGSTATIPSTVALEFGQASSISIASGSTLAILGPLVAGPAQYIFAGGGAVTMAIGAAPPIEIGWFGAVGDGVTDNTTAIQAALTIGSAILIPNGTFNFSATLNLPAEGGLFYGLGQGSILAYTGSGIALQRDTVAMPPQQTNLTLRSFTLRGNGAATTGIKIKNAFHVNIDDVYVDGNSGFTTAGIHLEGAAPDNIAVIRILLGEIRNCAGDGLRISGDGGASAILVLSNRIQSNTGKGINCPDTAGVELQVLGGVIEGNAAGGIYAEALRSSEIMGVHFELSAGVSNPHIKLGVNGTCRAVTIGGGNFGGGTPNYDIELGGPSTSVNIVIANNEFNGGATIAAVRLKQVNNVSLVDNEVNGPPALYDRSTFAGHGWLHVRDANGQAFLGGGSGSDRKHRFGTDALPSQLANDEILIMRDTMIREYDGTNANAIIGSDANGVPIVGGQTNTVDSGKAPRIAYVTASNLPAGSASNDGRIATTSAGHFWYYANGTKKELRGTTDGTDPVTGLNSALVPTTDSAGDSLGIADSATVSIPFAYGYLVISDNTTGNIAVVYVANSSTVVENKIGAEFTNTAGTAAKTNVYISGANLVIQNKTGGTSTYRANLYRFN